MSAMFSAEQLAALAAEVHRLVNRPGGMERFRAKVRELGAQHSDDEPALLPLEQRQWTLPQKYAILAAIHDEHGKGELIDPFADLAGEVGNKLPSQVPAVHAFMAYDELRRQARKDESTGVSRIPASDEPYLRMMLADVRGDLNRQPTLRPPIDWPLLIEVPDGWDNDHIQESDRPEVPHTSEPAEWAAYWKRMGARHHVRPKGGSPEAIREWLDYAAAVMETTEVAGWSNASTAWAVNDAFVYARCLGRSGRATDIPRKPDRECNPTEALQLLRDIHESIKTESVEPTKEIDNGAIRLAWVSENEARDEWMYKLRIDGESLQTIKIRLDRNEHGWQTVENLSSITAAIERYCDRHPDEPRPPKRKPGRRKT